MHIQHEWSQASASGRQHAAMDYDVKRRLLNFLRTCLLQDVASLQVEVCGGTVRIAGHVPTDEDRRLCVGSCRNMTGVVDVIDEISISGADDASGRAPGRPDGNRLPPW
jgi:osmotically-inducible protein OsmY